LNASLLRKYRSSRFNDSPNTTQLQMLQQRGLPAAEGTCQEEKTIFDHSKTVLSGMASHAIPTIVSLRFPDQVSLRHIAVLSRTTLYAPT
jgi:hypothetical protein